jgi:hypothetical protein
MTSLIQQRMAIDRLKVRGVMFTALGGLGFVLGVAMIIFGGFPSIALLMSLVGWLGFGAVGVLSLLQYRQRAGAFEAENGKGAGRQEPV